MCQTTRFCGGTQTLAPGHQLWITPDSLWRKGRREALETRLIGLTSHNLSSVSKFQFLFQLRLSLPLSNHHDNNNDHD